MPVLAVVALTAGSAFAQPSAPVRSTAVPVTAWEVLLPEGGYPSIPLLLAEADYVEENDLRSLAFGCSGAQYYVFVIAPGFPLQPVNPAILRLDGGDLRIQLRDLYGAPAPAAPDVDWDADVLYADISPRVLSRLAGMESAELTIGSRAWTLPLPGFAEHMETFFSACAR
jgi:hypothetical protein